MGLGTAQLTSLFAKELPKVFLKSLRESAAAAGTRNLQVQRLITVCTAFQLLVAVGGGF